MLRLEVALMVSASIVFVASPAMAIECDAMDPLGCDASTPATTDSGQVPVADSGDKLSDGGPSLTDPGFGTSEQASGNPSSPLVTLPPQSTSSCATTSGPGSLVAVPLAVGLLYMLRRRQPRKAPSARKRS